MNNHNKKTMHKASKRTILYLLDTEPHCSLTVDGNVLVSGNTDKPNDIGLVNAGLLSMDEFLIIKSNKNMRNIHLDHGNNHKKTTDKDGRVWSTSIAVWEYDENGKRHHRFVSSILKEYR